MPYEEIQHTADWSLRVWASDLPELFAEAARGMNMLTGARRVTGPRTQHTYDASAADVESLLVSFLSELVYLAEQEGVAFDEFDISVEGRKLKVMMKGAPLVSADKTIKAVTYHNLHIRQTERGYETEIVFDV